MSPGARIITACADEVAKLCGNTARALQGIIAIFERAQTSSDVYTRMNKIVVTSPSHVIVFSLFRDTKLTQNWRRCARQLEATLIAESRSNFGRCVLLDVPA